MQRIPGEQVWPLVESLALRLTGTSFDVLPANVKQHISAIMNDPQAGGGMPMIIRILEDCAGVVPRDRTPDELRTLIFDLPSKPRPKDT